jgi:hypothetical protein
MSNTARFVTLTTAVVDTPATATGSPALSRLLGLAMLIAEREENGSWSFTLHADVVEAGESASRLLEWAADRMPHPAVVIGWQLAEGVVAPLLDAAQHAEHVVGQYLIARLSRLLTGLSIDLAIVHGGASAPTFSIIAERARLEMMAMDDDALFTCWAFGTLDPVRDYLAAEAIALWRYWLREAGDDAAGADAATAAWSAAHG